MIIQVNNPPLQVSDGYSDSTIASSLIFQSNLTVTDDAGDLVIDNKKTNVYTVNTLKGEFDSIKDAIDSITSTPAVIEVAPGTYTEDPFTIPTGVTVKTDGHGTVTILPSTPTSDLITMEANSRLQGVTIRDVTGSSATAIRVASTGATPAILDYVTIVNCTEHIVVESDLVAAQAVYRNTRHISGSATVRFLRVESLAGNDAIVRMYGANFFTEDDGTLFEVGLYISGPGSRVDISLLMRSTTGVGDGILMRDGAELVAQVGSEIEGFNQTLFVENIGSAPILRTNTIMVAGSITWDINIEHVGTRGSILAKADVDGKVFVDTDAPIHLVLFDPDPGHSTGIFVRGDALQADRFDRKANLSKIAREATTLGLISGGDLTRNSGLTLDISAGTGFLLEPTDLFVKEIAWIDDSILLPANSDLYVFASTNSTITTSAAQPSLTTTILLGRVVTNATDIYFIESTLMSMQHRANSVETFQREALGPVFASGGTVAESTINNRELDITEGIRFYGSVILQTTGGDSVFFDAFYRDGYGDHTIVNSQVVDNAFYDDGSGILAAIPTGFFAKHTLYVASDGYEELYLQTYSQAVYATIAAAEVGALPTPPPLFKDAVTLIASLIVEEGNDNLALIVDERPRIGFSASSISTTADHNNLLNRGLDSAHTQYLLISGTREMTGPLDMGGFSITDVGTVDGVDVSTHASRHLPNGADPITTDAAITITDSTNSAGTANSLARSDHGHAHGTRAGGGLHSVATTSTAGFMSATDKTKLDRVREIFFQFDYGSNEGDFRTRDVGGSGNYRATFAVPQDFVSLVALEAIAINASSLTGVQNFDLESDYGAVGELYTTHSESDTIITYDFTGTTNEIVALNVASVFAALAAGDFCGLFINHQAIGGSLDYLGIRLRYNT